MSIFVEEVGDLLLKKSYIKMVENGVGSKMFRNFYSRVDGVVVDVLRNGDLSCAYHVSSILRTFGWVSETHSEVVATIEDMLNNDWRTISDPRIGAIIVWGDKLGESGETHKHIGFYIGNGIAVSNHDEERSPTKHHWTYDDSRNIEVILWHDELS